MDVGETTSRFRARMMIEEPDSVQVTLKVTMSVRDWCDLRDQLEEKLRSAHPSWKVSSAITDMLAQVRKVLYPSDGSGG